MGGIIRHLILLATNAAIAGFLLLPLSSLDGYFIATMRAQPLLLTLPAMLFFEVLVAYLILLFGAALQPLIIRSDKAKQKLEDWRVKFGKYGLLGVFLGSATPLPYSLMLYFESAAKLNKKSHVLIAVALGRIIKYSIIIGLYFAGSGLIDLIR